MQANELCGFTWDVGIEGEFEVECELPRGHHGNHEGSLSFWREPEKLGPVYYTPEQLEYRKRWAKTRDQMVALWQPAIQAQLNATPLLRSSNTSVQISEATGRSVALFTTMNDQAQAGQSTTSSASPAKPTETQ